LPIGNLILPGIFDVSSQFLPLAATHIDVERRATTLLASLLEIIISVFRLRKFF
jgi:hypothetical protein